MKYIIQLTFCVFLIGCASGGDPTSVYALKKVDSVVLDAASISSFKDCFLNELITTTAMGKAFARERMSEVRFSDRDTLILSDDVNIIVAAVDFYKGGKVDYFRSNIDMIPTQKENAAFKRCKNNSFQH